MSTQHFLRVYMYRLEWYKGTSYSIFTTKYEPIPGEADPFLFHFAIYLHEPAATELKSSLTFHYLAN